MNNLVNGVVNPPPCGSGRHQCEGRRVRNQAPERVINEHHWRAGLRLPFRFTAQSSRTPQTRQARKFLPPEGPPPGGWCAPEKL